MEIVPFWDPTLNQIFGKIKIIIMKKTLFILIIFLNFSYLTFSQENISQERIFVHHNTSFLVTGEYLYYKVYCLNNETNNLSKFSKIAYVELINSEKKQVFKHKIQLQYGMGQGDFFVPASLPSGNYKLIAYTQWMRNMDLANFYQNDISIINPFQENPKSLLKADISVSNDSVFSSKKSTKPIEIQQTTSNIIKLQLNSPYYSNRKKVTLKIKALKDPFSFGNYSISVRKIDKLQIPDKSTATSYINTSVQKTSNLTVDKTIWYLPELRGELFDGKVISKETGKPINNIKVALSIPGKNYIFKIANTNKKGIYYFNIDKKYENENATIQILDKERDRYKLVSNNSSVINYETLKFYDFKISKKEKDLILNHSIANQIENAYSGKKLDSFTNIENISPFYFDKAKTYDLDDYTRFKTIKETFIEIIPEIYSRERNGKFVFHVRIYGKEIETGLSPLVLIDGNLIQDQTELIDFNTFKIKSISVVEDMYMYGSKLFEGIISIHTFKGNYKNTLTNEAIKNIELSKPLALKKYFNQTYNDNTKLDRIPDFRRQLLWIPDLPLNNKEEIITFFTSDINGTYEICLEGFTVNGQPVSIKQVIVVGNNNKN